MSTLSMYARVFDKESPAWIDNRELNLFYIRSVQNHFNDTLILRGKVYLSEVYKMLGFPVTEDSCYVGWKYAENNTTGDNYIDFCIFDWLTNDEGADIQLDFNVDGVVI